MQTWQCLLGKLANSKHFFFFLCILLQLVTMSPATPAVEQTQYNKLHVSRLVLGIYSNQRLGS